MNLGFLDAQISMWRLRWLRVPVGLIAAWYLTDVVRHERHYRDRFHRPYIGWLPDLPPWAFTTVMSVGLVAALAMAAGVVPRIMSKVTFAVVVYHLLVLLEMREVPLAEVVAELARRHRS